jgi:DNA-binding response OmpR family regulator
VRVLVVEDEVDLASALATGLRREGYAVDVATTGGDAVEKLAINEYDLVTLDLNLPDMDGRAIARGLRGADAPGPRVLMLTARDALDDRVGGLDDGADDYLVKPFELKELYARVRALLRRDAGGGTAVAEVGPLRLDEARRTAAHDDVPLDLTTKEFALLRYFMTHPDEVLTTETLLEHVWDEHADPFTNTVRVTVSNLRKKLRGAGAGDLIETVVGVGYRLRAG